MKLTNEELEEWLERLPNYQHRRKNDTWELKSADESLEKPMPKEHCPFCGHVIDRSDNDDE